jgi:G3E family GTPase
VHKHWGASTFTHHPQHVHTHTTPSASRTHTEQVVNDVAEVNIDAKLLAHRQMAEEDEAYQDTVELENGCACCTLGPDLMDSILKLVRLSLRRDITYDRIVIEMSGVAEPRNLRDQFQDSKDAHQVFKYVDLETMLTVVDSAHFLELYASKQDIKDIPNLVLTPKDIQGGEAHIDSERRVVDLLVEMVECADYVVLNKTDRVPEANKNQLLMDIIKSLNPSAASVSCTWGKVPLDVVLGAPKGVGVCKVHDHMKEDIKRAVLSSQQQHVRSKRCIAVEEEEDISGTVFGSITFPQSASATNLSAGQKGGFAGPREMMPGMKRPKLSAR